ncbi:MAG: protein-L-isoaspartate(D-aspartate) O-methyltransferase [Deltaproteobacteria bacterium]|nr:protein-L-isoaspartate(D-aspartate) O-methyltransferase [Deltaproteobacteria bacterium]MBW2422003.1 protein-L-isoaspartate(D-aspartate) O-methyltransferase [Deltaproteobacteria bacterium]
MSTDASGAPGNYTIVRRRFVERLRRAGIRDARTLDAFEAVPRHRFVPEALRDQSYLETPLLIGDGQTISAPGVVAAMTQALALRGDESVLEIGTGSGYQAAILSRLAGSVVSVERIPRLAARARSALDALGVSNVIVFLGDGTQGRADQAPYDRVVVTAGGPEIPKPLLEQLAVGGFLVGPFGERDNQHLVRVQRADEGKYTREVLGRCNFVDLIGRNGWAA